jgi:hypothetical protein
MIPIGEKSRYHSTPLTERNGLISPASAKMFQDDRRKMASQHVFEVFSQTLAAQEALGLASS